MSSKPAVATTWRQQEAEWNEAESDLDEDDDLLKLGGGDEQEHEHQGVHGDGDVNAGAGEENASSSWAGVFLKTSLGGFLHGLTGTKVRSACAVQVYSLTRSMHKWA